MKNTNNLAKLALEVSQYFRYSHDSIFDESFDKFLELLEALGWTLNLSWSNDDLYNDDMKTLIAVRGNQTIVLNLDSSYDNDDVYIDDDTGWVLYEWTNFTLISGCIVNNDVVSKFESFDLEMLAAVM